MSGSEHEGGRARGRSGVQRREILRTVAGAGGAAVAGLLAAPYISNAQTAAGISLKVQTAWSAGGVGLQIFETWCHSIIERTSGELALQPFAADDISGIFEMMDAVAGGVLDGMHWAQTYWAATGRMPAGAFFTSFPMGLNHPHQWDMLFDSYGGTELARELYARQGLYFVGHVHQDLNLIHSKKPIRSLDDFKGLRIRMPGGLIAESFAAIGARTVTLPGPTFIPRWRRGRSTPPTSSDRRSIIVSGSRTWFRAAVLEAYLAEWCGFSLRLVDGLIGVDAAHIQWRSHGGPDEVPNGLALCALHHRLLDHGAITVGEDLRVRVARSVAGASARGLFEKLDRHEIRLPIDRQFHPNPEHLHWHHREVFKGRV